MAKQPEVWTVTVRRGAEERTTSLLVAEDRVVDPTDRIVANAARQLARRLGGGRPTRPEEGGR